MPDDVTDVPPPKRLPRGHPLIAWAVVAAVVVGLFVMRLAQRPAEGQQADLLEIQARALVGAASFGAKPADLYDQAKEMDRGSAAERLRFVVLAGELKGPDEALDRLGAVKDQLAQGDAPHADAADDLGRLYHDYQNGDWSAPSVGEDDRRELHQRLGWFGDLALHPANGPDAAGRAAVLAPARRTVIVDGLIVFVGLGGGAIGFVLLVLFAVLWRQMRSRFAVGSPYGGVYAETFAVWLVLYIGLIRAAALLPAGLPLAVTAGVPQALSLLALGWPVLRGVPWAQVRRDVGWSAGGRPALEPLCGILCYLAAMPVVILAALAVVAIVRFLQQVGGRNLLGPNGAPTHPIVFEVLHAGWFVWIQILFVASVMAPIVEETMFRGVLYRHVREATGRLGRVASVVLSALLVSFVFASLHPQGVAAIPLLMALAFGFTAAREWRGSLLGSMTVHALNNTAALLVLILTAS